MPSGEQIKRLNEKVKQKELEKVAAAIKPFVEKSSAEKAATDSKMATLESENQQQKAKLLELEAMLHNLIKVDKHEKDEIADAINELSEQISTAGEIHDSPND